MLCVHANMASCVTPSMIYQRPQAGTVVFPEPKGYDTTRLFRPRPSDSRSRLRNVCNRCRDYDPDSKAGWDSGTKPYKGTPISDEYCRQHLKQCWADPNKECHHHDDTEKWPSVNRNAMNVRAGRMNMTMGCLMTLVSQNALLRSRSTSWVTEPNTDVHWGPLKWVIG